MAPDPIELLRAAVEDGSRYVAHADIERILADEAVAALESRAAGRPAGPSG